MIHLNISFRNFSFLLLLMLFFHAKGQQRQGCIIFEDKSKTVNTDYRTSTGAYRRIGATTTLPVQLHFVVNAAGSRQDSAGAFNHLKYLNTIFASINIQFSVCNNIDYINSEDYNAIDFYSAFRLGEKYNSAGAIDIFYVPGIYGAGGLFSSFSNRDGFIMVNNNIPSPTVLVHEMGHYFNLRHTHDADYGTEVVTRGKNCEYAGDGFCDTPADPNLLNTSNSQCQYTGTALDPEGNPYQPDVTNFMAYSDDECRNKFSPEQYEHMHTYATNNLFARYHICENKPDYEVAIDQELNKLNKGVKNTVKVVFLNLSNASYSATNLSYSVKLVDQIKNEIPLISDHLTKSIGHNFVDTLTLELLIPASIEDGAYTLQITADSDNKYSEILENNNVATRRVAIFSNDKALPDIEITGNGKSFHPAGFEYEFEYIVRNVGNFDMDQFSYMYFISKDEIVSPDDIMNGPFYYSTTAPGEFYESKQNVLLPNKPGETYYILAVADYDQQETESNENNNILSIKVTLTPSSELHLSLPDFVLRNFSGGSPTVQISEWKRLNGKVDNIGDTTISNVRIETFYSLDSIFDSNDIKTYGRTERVYSNGNTTGDVMFPPTMPRNIPLGKAFLLIVLDPENQVKEKNEKNNITIFPITVVEDTEPYLEFEKIMVSDPHWYFGKNFSVNTTLKNISAGSSHMQFHSFHLMRADNYDYYTNRGIEIKNSTWLYNTVGPQESTGYEFTSTLTPDKISPGEYFLTVCVLVNSYTLSPPRVKYKTYAEKIEVGNEPVTNTEKSFETLDVDFYPNPANNYLYINNATKVHKLELLHQDGKKLLIIEHPETTIDISSIDEGMYFLKVTGDEGSYIRKIIIIR